ncbi:uncharacterized protein [Haliotis asinina]|uniref:uncharacterized protein n=1 Tax=Haliotis asinina TaxID=109174 RepID=UPI003531E0D2
MAVAPSVANEQVIEPEVDKVGLFDYVDHLMEIPTDTDTTSNGGKSTNSSKGGNRHKIERPKAGGKPPMGETRGVEKALKRLADGQAEQSQTMEKIGSVLELISSRLASGGDSRNQPSTSECMQDGGAHDSAQEGDSETDVDDMDILVENCMNAGGPKDKEQHNNDDCIDIDSLMADMREFFDDEDDTGADILSELAKSINDGLAKSPNMEKLKPLMDKYKRPRNTELLVVPRVNEEIWNGARPHTRGRDLKLQQTQGLLVKTAIPLVELMNTLMNAVMQKQAVNPKELLAKTKDSLRLLMGVHTDINVKRRENFKPDLQGPYKRLCARGIATTTKLFGDELSKTIKDINESKELSRKLHGDKTPKGGFQQSFRGGLGNRYKPYDISFRGHKKGYPVKGRGAHFGISDRGSSTTTQGTHRQGGLLGKRFGSRHDRQKQ